MVFTQKKKRQVDKIKTKITHLRNVGFERFKDKDINKLRFL